MATIQEKQSFMNNMSPVKEDAEEGDDMDYYEENVLGDGCRCFRVFCFKWRRSSDEKERRYLLQQKEEGREKWWEKKVKEVKKASEVLAGPKWKTFIRKLSGYCNNKKHKNNPFQYDSQSYALNFDGGLDREEDDFSARFAPTPDEHRRTGL